MKKRTLVLVAGASSVAIGLATVGIGGNANNRPSSSVDRQTLSFDRQTIERGRYLAVAGDCIACHTGSGEKPFAGGLRMDTPIGKIYSTNITPDKLTGIGNYTFTDFDRALRQGIRRDGDPLYPAMPFVSYARLKPADVRALYAYFMHGLEPVAQNNKAPEISWPLSMRWPLRVWAMTFAPQPEVDETPVPESGIARGRYLVEGLGHCGACHTPRGLGFQEKVLSNIDSRYLAGGVVDGYLAKNLRGDRQDGLGNWTHDQIVEFLKTGRNEHSAAFGSMADVIENSTQHLSISDLSAMAEFLKSLSPVTALEPNTTRSDLTAARLRVGSDRSNGSLTFVDNCAACHRTDGIGYDRTFPMLSQSSVVNSQDPTSLIHIVLRGAEMPSTQTAPTSFSMPGFAGRLTNRDIADLLTFVRSSWGNRAPPVSTEQVEKVRKSLHLTTPVRPENS
ncbi:c-type cytochrome [Burkholderia diffusa]|uniref:c-type cytochrome n=1 Tax=Burkholderia diffusa TaxID=488732 RepID=UPI0009BE41A3|nr:cytochrome c [Burkholderia diffusa]